MTTWIWLALIVVGVVVGWWLVKLTAAYSVSPEFAGLALLKQQLQNNGVDIKRIPEAALEEIVANKIKAAKGLSLAASISNNMPNDKNWRANLVRQIQSEVNLIPKILVEGPERNGFFDSTAVLLKYGLIKAK